MKLKNKLKMFEEFTSTTKNVETTIDSKGDVGATSKVNSILNDVDNILGNLETLSKQIDENVDQLIDSFTEELLEGILNEASAGEMMMQMFNDMKAMAKLSSSYKKMAAAKASLETEKTVYGLKFAEEKEEMVEAALDKVKDKINDKINAEKDPAKKQRLRAARDAKLETLKAQISDKIDQQKDDKNRQLARDISDTGEAISKLLSDNRISSPIMLARWEAMQLGIDRKIEDLNIQAEREAWDEFIEDEERLKKLEDAQLERLKKADAEAKRRLEQSKKDAEEAQAELDSKMAKVQGKEKEALDRIKEWNSAYIELSSNMNLTSESTPEEKEAAEEAYSRLNNATDALTKEVMKAAFGYDSDIEGETAAADFQERAEELSAEFKQIKAESIKK